MLVRVLEKIRDWLQKWSRKTHIQHGSVRSLLFISFNKERRPKSYSGCQSGIAGYPTTGRVLALERELVHVVIND
jgi:hypothetical protein